MENCTSIEGPQIVLVQEPLARYAPFIYHEVVVQRAQIPALVTPYLRWQYVRHGGIKAHTHLDFAPTGWEGYVVGLPPAEQQPALQKQGEEMLQALQYVCHQTGIPADQLLAEVAAATFTPRTANLLEPIFFTALAQMRAIGQDGVVMQEYSHWRTVCEQEISQLEEALQHTHTTAERHAVAHKLMVEEQLLQAKLAAVTHGRQSAASIYQTVHQEITANVTAMMQQVNEPFTIDPRAAQVRYCLPAGAELAPTDDVVLPADTPAWYILLHNLPLLGHPIIRAVLEREEEQ